MGWPTKELLVMILQMQYSVDYVWLKSCFHIQRKMSVISVIKVSPVLVRDTVLIGEVTLLTRELQKSLAGRELQGS